MLHYPNPIVEAGKAENRAKVGDFLAIARHLILAKGDVHLASKLAEARSTQRVQTIMKAAVSAGGVTIGTWGSQIAEYPAIVAAFLESLASYGAFDAMLSSMRRVPLHSRVSVVTVGASGTTVGESQATPISSLTLAAHSLALYKSLAHHRRVRYREGVGIQDHIARRTSVSGYDTEWRHN
jgi:hypothetical protein